MMNLNEYKSCISRTTSTKLENSTISKFRPLISLSSWKFCRCAPLFFICRFRGSPFFFACAALGAQFPARGFAAPTPIFFQTLAGPFFVYLSTYTQTLKIVCDTWKQDPWSNFKNMFGELWNAIWEAYDIISQYYTIEVHKVKSHVDDGHLDRYGMTLSNRYGNSGADRFSIWGLP